MEHRLRLNVAAFHSDLNGMQLSFDTNPNDLSVVLLRLVATIEEGVTGGAEGSC